MRTQATINDFLESRIAVNLSPITIQWYRDKLRRFACSCPELPETPGPIETFLAGVKGTPETRHAHFRALRALFRFLGERYDTSNPMAKVVAPRCPKKVMTTPKKKREQYKQNSVQDNTLSWGVYRVPRSLSSATITERRE